MGSERRRRWPLFAQRAPLIAADNRQRSQRPTTAPPPSQGFFSSGGCHVRKRRIRRKTVFGSKATFLRRRDGAEGCWRDWRFLILLQRSSQTDELTNSVPAAMPCSTSALNWCRAKKRCKTSGLFYSDLIKCNKKNKKILKKKIPLQTSHCGAALPGLTK